MSYGSYNAYKDTEGGFIILAIYVDDILMAGSDEVGIEAPSHIYNSILAYKY